MVNLKLPNDVSEEIKFYPKGRIVLILSSPEDSDRINMGVLKLLTEENYKIIYVAMNKPSTFVMKELKNLGIITNNIYFVDCATFVVTNSTARTDRCIIVDPKNLTGIGMAINEMIQGLAGNKVIFIDYLAVFLLYNNLGSMERFSHFLTNTIKFYSIKGILLSIEKDMKDKVLKSMQKFCDRTIVVKE
jgi:KaiC/GvpD/RAD55 family RecA-like ATPase